MSNIIKITVNDEINNNKGIEEIYGNPRDISLRFMRSVGTEFLAEFQVSTVFRLVRGLQTDQHATYSQADIYTSK